VVGGQLPVGDGGRVSGLVPMGDLVRHRIERMEAETKAFRGYLQSV